MRFARSFFLLAPLLALLTSCLALSSHDTWHCDANDDCPDGTYCRGANFYSGGADHVCAPNGTCEVDTDCYACSAAGCDSMFVCLDGKCKSAECTTSSHTTCGAYICDYTHGKCEVSCASNNDCSYGNLCKGTACVAGACVGSAALCAQYTASYLCTGNGCTWDGTAACRGAPTPCTNEKDASNCSSRLGCSWQ